jgi:hypothetical protein
MNRYFIYLLGALVGFAISVIYIRILLKECNVRKWKKTLGVITNNEILPIESSEGEIYKFKVEYKFLVDGIDYMGNRRRVKEWCYNQFKVEEIKKRYDVNCKVEVYYDENNPDNCVLENNISYSVFAMLGTGLVFFCSGLMSYFVL